MISKARTYVDLIAVVVLTFLMLLVVYVINGQILRVILGLVFLLFIPGYALIASLFPRKQDLQTVERLAFSAGLSIALAPLMGLVLDITPWGITLESILVLVISFTLLSCLVAYYRRSSLSPEERFELELFQGQEPPHLERFYSVALLLVLAAVFGALVWVAVNPKTGRRFTEFYLLEPLARAESYPVEVTVGEPITLILGVVNHERGDVEYRIERAGSSGREQIASLQLAHEEMWEQPYTFALTQSGENQKIEFLMYKGDEDEPYRSLHLWITVKEKQ